MPGGRYRSKGRPALRRTTEKNTKVKNRKLSEVGTRINPLDY